MGKQRARRRILFASSDAATVSVHSQGLAQQGNHVSIARSLAAARQGLSEHAFNLLVLDLGIAESGLELLRELRRWRDETTLPAIALVQPNEGPTVAEARQAGANRALPKPVQSAVLAACAEVVMGESAVERGTRREQELVTELQAVDEALARHLAGAETAEHKAVDLLGGALTGGPYHTGEYEAATVNGLRAASIGRTGSGVGDTAEQAAIDWVLFKAIEQALSVSLEQHRPLSLLMVEAHPAQGDEAATLLQTLAPMGEALIRGARAHRLASGVTCVVLPEATEADAVRAAELVITSGGAAGAGAPVGGVHVGVATLPAQFQGSPFRLIDHARDALLFALASGPSGYHVRSVEVAPG